MIQDKYIFLAEDDMDDCFLFTEAIKDISSDVRVNVAKDGRELMSILNSAGLPKPDLIFLDLNMPIKDGFECLTEIKETQELKGIPVVILSTSSNPQHIDKTYHDGASYYLRKPIQFDKLKAAIHKVFSLNLSARDAQPPREQFFLAY